jgi:hypothetical protein
MKVPWSRIASWHCTACGKCCREYRVPLTFWEYLRFRSIGAVEEKKGKYYLRKVGKRCLFQDGRFCSVQKRKPVACLVFPFVVKSRGEDSALFWYNDEEYYVYVDTYCENVVLGKPDIQLKKRIIEAIQISTGTRRFSEVLTFSPAFDLTFSRGMNMSNKI